MNKDLCTLLKKIKQQVDALKDNRKVKENKALEDILADITRIILYINEYKEIASSKEINRNLVEIDNLVNELVELVNNGNYLLRENLKSLVKGIVSNYDAQEIEKLKKEAIKKFEPVKKYEFNEDTMQTLFSAFGEGLVILDKALVLARSTNPAKLNELKNIEKDAIKTLFERIDKRPRIMNINATLTDASLKRLTPGK